MKSKEIYRNEIKSYIIRAGMTMSEAVEFWPMNTFGAAASRICPTN